MDNKSDFETPKCVYCNSLENLCWNMNNLIFLNDKKIYICKNCLEAINMIDG